MHLKRVLLLDLLLGFTALVGPLEVFHRKSITRIRGCPLFMIISHVFYSFSMWNLLSTCFNQSTWTIVSQPFAWENKKTQNKTKNKELLENMITEEKQNIWRLIWFANGNYNDLPENEWAWNQIVLSNNNKKKKWILFSFVSCKKKKVLSKHYTNYFKSSVFGVLVQLYQGHYWDRSVYFR